MRVYRLFNLSEHGPASGLHFLDRDEADRYRELVKWPYANEGTWPLADGRELPLERVELRVEPLERRWLAEPELGVVVFEQEGQLGGAPLLPGNCFDPDEWQAAPATELANPETAALWEKARLALKAA
jgi:hypothetical protein